MSVVLAQGALGLVSYSATDVASPVLAGYMLISASGPMWVGASLAMCQMPSIPINESFSGWQEVEGSGESKFLSPGEKHSTK